MHDLSLPSDPFHQQRRELEDCAIAFHDALKILGDSEGRELLECVQRRLERAVSQLRLSDEDHRGDAEGAEAGKEEE